jgi:hypothetical protein
MKEKHLHIILIIAGLFSCSMLSYSISFFSWYNEFEGAFKPILILINIPIYTIVLLNQLYYKKYLNYLVLCTIVLCMPYFSVFLYNDETMHYITMFNFLICLSVVLFLIKKIW